MINQSCVCISASEYWWIQGMHLKRITNLNAYFMRCNVWSFPDSENLCIKKVLSCWGWEEMSVISQTIKIRIPFYFVKITEFYWIFLNLVPIDNMLVLVQIMAWCQWGDNCLNQCWLWYLMPCGLTRPQLHPGGIDEHSLVTFDNCGINEYFIWGPCRHDEPQTDKTESISYVEDNNGPKKCQCDLQKWFCFSSTELYYICSVCIE